MQEVSVLRICEYLKSEYSYWYWSEKYAELHLFGNNDSVEMTRNENKLYQLQVATFKSDVCCITKTDLRGAVWCHRASTPAQITEEEI